MHFITWDVCELKATLMFIKEVHNIKQKQPTITTP